MAKKDLIPFQTPFGTARFPKLNEPDMKFPKNGKGVYKTDVLYEGEALEAVTKTLSDAAAKLWPGEDIELPIHEFFTDKTKKTSQGKGITVKTTKRPAMYDAKNRKLPETVQVGGGSTIRVCGVIAAYENTDTETIIENGVKRKEQVTVHGITLYLDQVQVRTLVAGRAQGPQFEAEEGGYEYDGSENESAFGDSNDPTDL